MMKQTILVAAVLALVAGLAVAQDSVSPAQGLPGDAVSPFDTSEQVNNYVVDLSTFFTSWGTKLGIAPIAKSSKIDSGFFNGFVNAQAISRTLTTDVPFVRNSYAFWTGQGFGINGAVNNAPSSINTTGFVGNQFAFGFSDSEGDTNDIIGGVVNYLPQRASRLYVSRVVAASNSASVAENRSQFGFGSVDSDGNILFRADGFGTSGPNPLSGNNWFRVELDGRNAAIQNIIDNSGASDGAATDWLLVRDGSVHSPQTNIPESLAGRSVLAGTNFNTQYVFESAPGVLSTTTAHRTGSSDQRGTISFHDVLAVPGAGNVGTMAIFGKDAAVGGLTRRILLWGVTGNGSVNGTVSIDPPTTITDNDDSFVFPNGGTIDEFIHHVSQVAFRGGNGNVSVGMDQAGRALVAVPVVSSALAPSSTNPINAIAVARFDPADPSGTLEWTLAGYNDFPNGKQILDGPDGNPIGQLVELNQVTGGSPFGPSMSSPCIDAVGNVWFITTAEIYPRPTVNSRGAFNDFDTVLVRAVYDPDTFSYQLELVAEVGNTFFGKNSLTRYQLRFFGVADSDSISSGTFWSGNLMRTPIGGIDVSNLETRDPRTFGGLVFQAQIVYDVNGDGNFVKVTGGGGDPASEDQEYNVLLYVGPTSAQTAQSF